MLSEYEKFIKRCRDHGVPLLSFNCPHCGGATETPAATDGGTWDTMASCPHCDGLYIKLVDRHSVLTKRLA